MALANLLEKDSERRAAEYAKSKAKAEEAIRDRKGVEDSLKRIVPALFDGEYPVKKWVVIEPGSSPCCGDGTNALAAVLDGEILLYVYRNSYCYQLTVGVYESGSADCWAKKPNETLWKELSTPESNEANLAKMIGKINAR